jgi:FtsP/CotA-like multicopper oxidase with cupredoxin domain
MVTLPNGKRMEVNYVNMLDEPTNLHFHGLHVSPSGNSDNVFRVVGPGQTAKYVIDIPVNHAQGTMWYHAHLHGLVTTQVGGGMSGLIVIELHNITKRTFAMKAFPWNRDPTAPIYQTINALYPCACSRNDILESVQKSTT